jgi:RNA polymerase sigma factor (sigma-70 family)
MDKLSLPHGVPGRNHRRSSGKAILASDCWQAGWLSAGAACYMAGVNLHSTSEFALTSGSKGTDPSLCSVLVFAYCTEKPAPPLYSITVLPAFERKELIVTYVLAGAGPTDIEYRLVLDAQAYLRSLGQAGEDNPHLCQAWQRFYALFSPLIRRIVRSSRIPLADLDDCVQEVWLELVRKLPSFDYQPLQAPFGAWLSTLVRRKVTHWLRQRELTVVHNLNGHADLVPSFLPGPDEVCQTREARELLDRLLAELRQQVSYSTQEVLRLRWVEGRSVMEAGLLLGMKPRQIWNREYRAKQRLRELMQQDQIGDSRGFAVPETLADPQNSRRWKNSTRGAPGSWQL